MKKLKQKRWGLPYELIIEIFRRLSLKTLGRFKLVSKYWYLLLSSNKFVASLLPYSHLAKPRTLIFQSHNSISSLRFKDFNNDDAIEFGLRLTYLKHPLPKTRRGIHYYCAGSYNGLVCIHITTPEFEERVVVWNPMTRELKAIPLPPSGDDEPVNYASSFKKRFWFGYVEPLEDVIIFCLKQKTRSYVFSMKRNRWRESRNSGRFDIGSEEEGCRNLGSRFVHIDGVLYCNLSLGYILKFDLVKETLRMMKFLNTQNNEFFEILDASLGVTKDKKLCSGRVFECKWHDQWILEIWTLQDDTELGLSSWEMLHWFRLGKEPLGPCGYPWLIRFTHDGKVFVGGNKLVIVDPNQVSSLQVQEVKTKHVPIYAVDYVQTLLSPHSLEEVYLLEEQYM